MKTEEELSKEKEKEKLFTQSQNIVEEIENSMERWHLGRDNDAETLNDINDVLYKNGYLTFFNDKKTKFLKQNKSVILINKNKTKWKKIKLKKY